MEINYSGLISLAIFLVVLVVFLRYEALHEDEEDVVTETTTNVLPATSSPLDLNDEDATVACLIASIELRQETNKNVQVISVREVK